MMTLIHEGGIPMWFILLFGVGGLGYAAFFAARPARRRLAVVKSLGVATAATALSGTFAALGAVFHQVPERFADKPDWPMILLTGLGESMSAGIMGFSFVALMGLVASLGVGRLADHPA